MRKSKTSATDGYGMKKGTFHPLNLGYRRGALMPNLISGRQRMKGRYIADVYYPAFYYGNNIYRISRV